MTVLTSQYVLVFLNALLSVKTVSENICGLHIMSSAATTRDVKSSLTQYGVQLNVPAVITS